LVAKKITKDQPSKPKKEKPKTVFVDPVKAYQDALRKEEEEAWREKIFTIVLSSFASLLVIMIVWVVYRVTKQSKFYQKIERQKQEVENRKKLVDTTSKVVQQTIQRKQKFLKKRKKLFPRKWKERKKELML